MLNMSKYNFFISYCRTDGEDIAIQLSKQLTEKGYSVFIDIESIRAGSDFTQSIIDVISNCDYFVPIITDATSKSQWVMKEISFAFSQAESRATQIIPIVATEHLDDVLQYYLAPIQRIRLNRNVEISVAVNKIVEQIDQFVEHKLNSALLYEKLSEYKKLNNYNKEAETICELIRLIRENYIRTPKVVFSKIWILCEELLNLYTQLSKYTGSYNEESRKVVHKILNELDETYSMLNTPAKNGKKNLFQRHILFAAVAIRIIHIEREIRCECIDILSNGDVKNACPISVYIEKQKGFVEVFNSEYFKTNDQGFEESKRCFIEETSKYIFGTSNKVYLESAIEKEICNALIKCGYNVEREFRLNNFIVDLVIKKNGKHLLFIELISTLANTQRVLESKKELASYIESIGGKLHIIRTEDWSKNPQIEIEKIKNIIDSVATQDDELFVSIARFIQDGNKLFDVFQKKGIAGDFLECLRESYERLKNYCVVVGADDVAAECAERIVEIRNEVGKQQKNKTENEKAEKGIKSLLGFTLEDSGKYDVFISFKNEDSDLAEKIYEYCHKRIKQPFWSKKSLPRLSKSEYSKAIDMALENSKHFVVVLSDLKYLDAEWIKYEMDVFNNEIKEGRKKASNFIIVATDDVYDHIIKSNKTVLDIAYRRYQIIKMSEYEETLAQYIS